MEIMQNNSEISILQILYSGSVVLNAKDYYLTRVQDLYTPDIEYLLKIAQIMNPKFK